MTEFYHHEQEQTKLSEPSSLLTRSEMPNYYPPPRHRTLVTTHLADPHEDDPDSIYKEAFILQIFQHWKIKTLEHQHAINNAENNPTSNHFSQALAKTEPSNLETISHETSSNNNKEDVSNINETEKPITTMRKRVTPLPASHIRRKDNTLKKTLTSPTDFTNPNLLTPHKNNKSRTTTTTTPTKKPTKPAPIFIAPKKTTPAPIPRSASLFSFDESTQNKRKMALDKQTFISDDQSPTPISPLWTPTPPITPARFFVQSPGSSLDDDDKTSSDDDSYESLLIRNKKGSKKPSTPKENYPLPPHLTLPTAIFITDPNGHARLYDLTEELVNTERIIDNDIIALQPIRGISPPVSPLSLDQYTLHSIGEEDEGSIEKDNNDGVILSKELNRIEAFTRSRQPSPNVQTNQTNKNSNENNKNLLGRRWSDGGVSDDEEHSQSSLVKMASTTSIIKQPITPPVKISKTKYLLMKLHLTSSPNKEEESNTSTTNLPPAPPRKRSRTNIATPQSSIDESKQSSSKSNRLDSSSTVLSTNTTNSQPVQRNVSFIDSDYDRQDSLNSKPESIGNRETIPDSEDDTENNLLKAKPGSTKRASSFIDIRGSQLSLSSIMSEAKARYDLDITGTIEVKLSYNKNTSSLDILITKCTNLARAHRHQSSNPYCKIYLLPDRSKNSKRKTAVRKSTTEPVFNETLRYHLSLQDFDLRILWISVWHQSSLGHNDFLGEINIPLANCSLDVLEEYTLLPRVQPENLTPNIEPADEKCELHFELTVIKHTKNKELVTIQVNSIHGTGIHHGKHTVDAICKGLLMPDRIKRKLPITRKGPSPKWDIPLRWENIPLDTLKNTSLEISIWDQERFRKTMIGYVRLNSARGRSDTNAVKFLDATPAERKEWDSFLAKPTEIHKIKLPLRPATKEQK